MRAYRRGIYARDRSIFRVLSVSHTSLSSRRRCLPLPRLSLTFFSYVGIILSRPPLTVPFSIPAPPPRAHVPRYARVCPREKEKCITAGRERERLLSPIPVFRARNGAGNPASGFIGRGLCRYFRDCSSRNVVHAR